MNEQNKKINDLLEEVALKMNLQRDEVAKKLPVIDDEIIAALNFSLSAKANESDKWLPVTPNTLLALKSIMHPKWSDAYSPKEFQNVSADATAGVTFAFYWSDGYLCWER